MAYGEVLQTFTLERSSELFPLHGRLVFFPKDTGTGVPYAICTVSSEHSRTVLHLKSV